MHPNNTYIKNYNEVKSHPGDIGVLELMSADDKRLLGI
jgi:hypothetical protein